jgi:hypothetical protein
MILSGYTTLALRELKRSTSPFMLQWTLRTVFPLTVAKPKEFPLDKIRSMLDILCSTDQSFSHTKKLESSIREADDSCLQRCCTAQVQCASPRGHPCYASSISLNVNRLETQFSDYGFGIPDSPSLRTVTPSADSTTGWEFRQCHSGNKWSSVVAFGLA